MSAAEGTTPGDRPPWADAVIVDEIDAVDAQFGGEFSEETRSMMKKYEKPKWLDEESSLDPVDDMEEHLEHGLRLPPRTYDAAQEAAAEEAAELRAAKQDKLNPDEESLIRYRKALVEGTPMEELKLLKLRAYHRAMDAASARQAAHESEARRLVMEEHDVPLDAVPIDLIDMTPEQLAERWAANRRSSTRMGLHDAPCEYSEESEWAADWAAADYLTSAAGRSQLQNMLTGPKSPYVQLAPRPVPQPGEAMLHGDPARYQRYKPVHGFTHEYLEQQQLQRKWRNQRWQRAAAFWLPLGSILGIYAVKGLRSLIKSRTAKAKPTKGKKKKTAL